MPATIYWKNRSMFMSFSQTIGSIRPCKYSRSFPAPQLLLLFERRELPFPDRQHFEGLNIKAVMVCRRKIKDSRGPDKAFHVFDGGPHVAAVETLLTDRLREDHQRVIGVTTKGAHILLVFCFICFFIRRSDSLLRMFCRQRFRDN